MAVINRSARQRNRWLLAAAIAWPVLIVAILLDPVAVSADWPLWAQIAGGAVLGLVVLNAAILGPVLALFSQADARAFDRLMRGEGVVARWTVSPATWEAFLAANGRHSEAGGPVNLLDTRMSCPPSGLACVATRDAVLIGEDFHNIRGMGLVGRVGWLDDNPGMIEVDAAAPRGGSSAGLSPRRLRFPLGKAHKAARDLHAAWLHRAGLIGNPGATSNPLRRRNLALAALGLGIVIAAVPIARHGFAATLEGREGGAEALALIPAIFLIAFGFGFALRFHLDSRREAKLATGEGLIGSWWVTPAEWQAFQAFDADRRAREDVPWNLVDTWRRPSMDGVRVTVAEETVQVGRDLFHIPSFAALGVTAVSWLDRRPACIELRGIYQARVGAFSRFAVPAGDGGPFTLRFPVAAGAEETGRRALEAWRRFVRG